MKSIHYSVYGDSQRGASPGPIKNNEELVRLALLFTLLAVGALFAPGLPPRSARAEQLFQIGRAALMNAQVDKSPSIEVIQALCLQNSYMRSSAVSMQTGCWSRSGYRTSHSVQNVRNS
jgi:hypothetical protein